MLSRLIVSASFVLAAFAPATPAAGQNYVARADSLLRRGRVFAAESLYYYAVRRQPRDPGARLALGRYLAARGRLRVGAVLMEEARFFGGDPKVVGAALAPVYDALGDYKALAGMPGSPLPYPQRARAEWLKGNPPATSGPDSLMLPYAPSDSGALGRLTLVVGDDTLRAVLDPRVRGLVLDTAWMRRAEVVKVFASSTDGDPRTAAGVVLAVGLGELTLANVPARFDPTLAAGELRLGLDVLETLSPTFDPALGLVVLRRVGDVEVADGIRVPTLRYATGLWLVDPEGVAPLLGREVDARVRSTRWTIDAGKGEIVVER
jgi:hypothetical protein